MVQPCSIPWSSFAYHSVIGQPVRRISILSPRAAVSPGETI